MKNKLDFILERNPNMELMILDGLDDAVIGRVSEEVKDENGNVEKIINKLVYSTEKCVEVMMKEQKWDYEEATEYLEFNTFCAYFGEFTPIIKEDRFEECED